MMNRVAEILGIKYPFIQGAMSWLTDAKFVAPAYYRSLPTTLHNQLVKNDQEKSGQEVLDVNAKLMGGTSGMRIGMLEGDLEHGYVSVGTGISMIHEIQSVEDVVN